MPSQVDNDIADITSNNIFTSSDYKERPITMSITQSNSFESSQLSGINMDGKDLAISLSASSESLGFDENSVGVDLHLKGSFGVEEEEKRKGSAGFEDNNNSNNNNCEAPVVRSAGTHENNNCEASVTSARTNDSNQGSASSSQGRPGQPSGYGPRVHPHGPPPHNYHLQSYNNMPSHAPQYHPHYQRQYYPPVGSGPHYPGNHHGGQSQQYDHRFPSNGPQGPYQGLHYPPPHSHQAYPPHSNYPPPQGFRQGHSHPPPSSSSSNRQYIQNSNSSVMSVSSHGSSRKRNLDGMMEDDPRANSFTKHRSSSNSSTCSTATTGNNTSSDTIKQMICESPLKRERTISPIVNTDRKESSESGSAALSFGGLNMGNSEKDSFHSMISTKPMMKSKKEADIGVTPVSKNTKSRPNQTNFSFDEETETQTKRYSPEGHSLNKQLRDQSFTPIHPTELKRESSSSPTFNEQLEIVPQLSWSIADDTPALGDLSDWPKSTERDASPMSFNGNISPMMFNISPSDVKNERNENPTSVKKEEDIMRMGVLSPTDDSSNGGNSNSPPLMFPNVPLRHDYPRPQGRKPHSPQAMSKPPYPKQYRVHEPFPAISPKGAMPLGSPQSYQLHSNPPTPQGPKLSHPSHNFDRREDNYHRNMHPGSREGPPTPNYQSPRGVYQGQLHGQDRIRNLRGRVHGTLPPPINLPPHFPTHAHFLTSPIGPTPRGMMLSSPHHRMGTHHFPRSPHMAASKRKCIPLKPPIPSKFQGDMEKFKNSTVPEFTSLVNFPAHMSQKQATMIPDGMRCCVMCGHACPCSSSNKNRKGKKNPGDASTSDTRSNIGSPYAIIPTQNKGLCTQCDVNVWVVTSNNLEIKWCKGCKNFRPWAAFGEKGLATKCMRCRERQREKYAAQKEEKDKKKALSKAKSLNSK